MSLQLNVFEKKVDAFYLDCEFAEYIANYHTLLSNAEKSGFEFHKKASRYPLLSTKNSTDKRKETVNHLRRTIYSSFIKDLYEEVCIYLIDSMDCIIRHLDNSGILRVFAESEIKMTPRQILEIGTYEQVVDYIAKERFKEMEVAQKRSKNNNKLNIITQFQNRFGLNIPQSIVDGAMPYLKLRHIFVHSDGIPDSCFLNEFPQFQPPKGKKKIPLTHILVEDAYKKVTKLIKEIDNDLETKKLI